MISMAYSSCNSSTMSTNPHSFGALNKILVVCDQDLWDDHIGDTIRYYLGAAYPVLPQPEPMFDLQHVTASKFEGARQLHYMRSILFIGEMTSTNSPTGNLIKKMIGDDNISKMRAKGNQANIKVGKNRWANNQRVLFLYADGDNAIIDGIKSKAGAIADVVQEVERSVLDARIYIKGQSGKANELIKNTFNIKIPIPSEYVLAHHDKDKKFVWLRKIDNANDFHIMVYELPYENVEQLSPQGIKSVRDSLGKWYVESGQIEGSHMQVNDIDLRLYDESISLNNQRAMNVRGIWEMSDFKDMMGGAFSSYMILDSNNNKLIFIDGFVYAPGERKRDRMQEIELILTQTQILQ